MGEAVLLAMRLTMRLTKKGKAAKKKNKFIYFQVSSPFGEGKTSPKGEETVKTIFFFYFLDVAIRSVSEIGVKFYFTKGLIFC
ncbi:hypothetical protein AHMF7605_21850 [Adhaeribacter arboris]|uniref:Uncharacterized protein n=1 Tax=Adhaeribacter arboris TaxID=2072846 RepID=A0A2T2YKB4_9BACT|nr:hypothetical protein AHMF7605_21850 [Adhaeribacter arboris]